MNTNGLPLEERLDPDDPEWRGRMSVFAQRTDFARAFCHQKRVLDAPCGVGWTTKRLGEVATFVEAIDYSEDAIRHAVRANAAPNIRYQVMDARCLVFPERSFDVAVSLEGIEHLTARDGLKYLRELNRVLNVSGMLVGSTPRAETRKDARTALEMSRYRGHKHIYKVSELRRVLRRFFCRVCIIRTDEACLFCAVKHYEPMPLLPEALRHEMYVLKERFLALLRPQV